MQNILPYTVYNIVFKIPWRYVIYSLVCPA